MKIKITKSEVRVHYLGASKKGGEGWVFVEKTREFKSLLEALEKTKELMKKNRKIAKAFFEETLRDIEIGLNVAFIIYNEDYKEKAKN